MRTCSISIDMGSITEYAALNQVLIKAEDPLLMYRSPLDRFISLCESTEQVATLFIITRDVTGLAIEKLKKLSFKGFELASMSHNHNWQLANLLPGEILKDIKQSKEFIKKNFNQTPYGFRAPGYFINKKLISELIGLGFRYDSSVVPSSLYFTKKIMTRAMNKLAGNKSILLPFQPGSFNSPKSPYRPNLNPYKASGELNIIELPIAVATPLGIPVTAASLLQASEKIRTLMLKSLKEQDIITLSFQIIDFVDPNKDNLPNEFLKKYPYLLEPVNVRLEKLEHWLQEINKERWTLTCGQLAEQLI